MQDATPKTLSRVDPSVHILDEGFKYIPAARTDISATFERVRAEQAKAKAPIAVVELRRGRK